MLLTSRELDAPTKGRISKATQTLLGICAGIVADGQINERELIYLATWLRENAEVASCWPGNVVASRVAAILADGVATSEELADLTQVLQELSGNAFADTGSPSPETPVAPVDDGPDEIEFRGKSFCFTGKFVYGVRKSCEQAVIDLGAIVQPRVTKSLDYLVIGSFVQDAWKHDTYGNKIEIAAKYRQNGDRPIILFEDHWTILLCQAQETAAA